MRFPQNPGRGYDGTGAEAPVHYTARSTGTAGPSSLPELNAVVPHRGFGIGAGQRGFVIHHVPQLLHRVARLHGYVLFQSMYELPLRERPTAVSPRVRLTNTLLSLKSCQIVFPHKQES